MNSNNTNEAEITPAAEDFFKKYGIYKLHFTLFEKFKFILLTGLALISALAWDEGMRSVFSEYFAPIESPLGKLIYAAFLTLMTLVAALILKKKK